MLPRDEQLRSALKTAASALKEHGPRFALAGSVAVERTPEDWLFKAHVDDVVVDVLRRVNGVAVDTDSLDGAEDHQVLAITCRTHPVRADTADNDFAVAFLVLADRLQITG